MTRGDLAREWDVAVVGAGVAGAMSALRLARTGLSVLLVEKSTWPRDKPCGGCLNAAALRALAQAGIELHEGGAITGLRLACRGRTARLALPHGVAITRRRLDALLVEHATNAGACFLPATRAILGDVTPHGRSVVLRTHAADRTIRARVVLDCGGLATRLLPDVGWRAMRPARIGVGAALASVPTGFASGTIHMACSSHGYVGVVRAERGMANIAAALDPVHCRKLGGPAHVVREILEAAGLPVPHGLDRLDWRGTPHLTRTRCQLGARRVLILGDAAGYMEPFTGEGMAWALADATAVLPFASEAAVHWSDNLAIRWRKQHSRMLRARHRICRGVSKLLRHPDLLAVALPLLDRAPAIAAPLVAWVNRDFNTNAAVAG